MPRFRPLRLGLAVAAMTAGALLPAAAAAAAPGAPPASDQAAGVINLYIAPTAHVGANGTAVRASSATATATGALANPFTSIQQAIPEAHQLSAKGNVVVHLAGGVYRLAKPLRFTAADSGLDGHTITYAAAAGQDPVMSGSRQVTGWTQYNASNNIWVASVGTGTNTRQLYVNGAEAPRAAVQVPRSDFTFTATGLTFTTSSLSYLDAATDQSQIEVESVDSFTDRYATVASISGGTITMQQPGWSNNNFGYDVLASPFEGGTMYLENNYAFLQQAGQWYLDSATGQLFYKAQSGQNPNSLDVELPGSQPLVQVSGSYASPASGLIFSNITFTGTTWLGPSSSQGYADQQSGTFLTGTWSQPSFGSCFSGCQQFEATRQDWDQMPAAVQVSAATGITFTGDTFTDLGQVGLGIGNDNDATASGTGLGASDITVVGNTFSGDAGGGIVVGGVQANAHHPGNAAMTDQNITISNNHVTNIGTDYKEVAAILSTYVTSATIVHNQVDHLPYDAIDVGWGWGINDPGGSQDYVNRGTYNYQPLYTTPTTLKNTTVAYNLIFDTKNVMHDGGSIYNLSADPGTVIEDNYMFNNNGTVALYLDEGSRYVTLSSNVVQDAGVWAFTNANANNNTDGNTFSGNWDNGGATEIATGSPHNNVSTGNVTVSGYAWPAGAAQVINQAGIQYSSGRFPTGYRQLTIGNDGLCTDVSGNSTAAGAAIDQQACNGQSSQQFQFVPTTGGYGELLAENSGDVVAVSGGSTAAGALVTQQVPTGSAPAGLWLPVRQADGSFSFQNANSRLCLDVTGATSNAGQQLDQWTCKNATATNQDFTPGPAGAYPAGYHQVTIGNDGLCTGVSGGSTAAGAAISQASCNGQSSQQFQFVPTTGGYGELQAQNSGDDIAVSGTSTAQGTPDITQQAPNGSSVSLWLPVQQADGSYSFQNAASGLCLDVFGANNTIGQQLDQWTCKNAAATNQDFTPH
jgi:Ricin-type beta-trefoil lectin domain-like